MSIQTAARLAFKATQSDLDHLEAIAATLRQSGRPFTTRTDALRVCLRVAASDPTRVLAESRQ